MFNSYLVWEAFKETFGSRSCDTLTITVHVSFARTKNHIQREGLFIRKGLIFFPENWTRISSINKINESNCEDWAKVLIWFAAIADLPRITNVTTPPLLRIGQNMSLSCTASGLLPVEVTWYKGNKALANGFSEALLPLKTITDKDWGEFQCVAKNSVGEDKKSVLLKGKWPTFIARHLFRV